jgi:hypothetical protein
VLILSGTCPAFLRKPITTTGLVCLAVFSSSFNLLRDQGEKENKEFLSLKLFLSFMLLAKKVDRDY